MAMIHHFEFDPLFAHGAIGVLASHGFIRSQGSLVSVEDVQTLVKNIDGMRSSGKVYMQPKELAQTLGVSVSAVESFFCRGIKGSAKHTADINVYEAKEKLTKLLGAKG